MLRRFRNLIAQSPRAFENLCRASRKTTGSPNATCCHPMRTLSFRELPFSTTLQGLGPTQKTLFVSNLTVLQSSGCRARFSLRLHLVRKYLRLSGVEIAINPKHSRCHDRMVGVSRMGAHGLQQVIPCRFCGSMLTARTCKSCRTSE